MHPHSRSCHKYKSGNCRYHFGNFFTEITNVATPLPSDLSQEMKNSILSEHERILSKVKVYIDKNLDPKKQNNLNPTKDDFEKVPEISEILAEFNVTEREYYSALSISNDSDFQIHLKRQLNACFINNFFSEGLQVWQANIDIQPVFNHYKAVTYMCAYFSKAEDKTCEAIKQTAKEALNASKTEFETMKAIPKAYSTKRECSVQEAVYHILPELWLRKTFPKVIFLNSNMPEKWYRFF